jgi:hypothetical protein
MFMPIYYGKKARRQVKNEFWAIFFEGGGMLPAITPTSATPE